MEWLLITWISLIVIVALIAGLIFYKKNKELNKKIEKFNAQKPRVSERWLS